jgi:dimethylglycine dehydrogenase
MSQEVRADGIPRDFGMELFGGDLERLLPHLEESMERVPTVAEAEIETVVHGPVSWSPDGNPIIGPQPGAANMWTMCGFSYGIIHAGGASAYLADWMTKGEAPYELNEFDPHRYGATSVTSCSQSERLT